MTKTVDYFLSLNALLGVYGIKTSRLQSNQDYWTCAKALWPNLSEADSSLSSLQQQIKDIAKDERKRLALANISNVPATFLSTAPVHVHRVVRSRDGLADAMPETDPPITEESLERMMANSSPQMTDGAPFGCDGQLDIDPAKLLRKVVSAVISGGQGHLLYDFPDVLAFFGSRIPDREELAGHTGVDERMFEAKARWPNRTGAVEAAQ